MPPPGETAIRQLTQDKGPQESSLLDNLVDSHLFVGRRSKQLQIRRYATHVPRNPPVDGRRSAL